MDYPNPVHGEEKFCNACEDAQVLDTWFTICVCGNDSSTGWIGPHTGDFYHELSYVDGKSESVKNLEECRHDKPKALGWQDDGNLV